MSLADGLATALRCYLDANAQHGLEALLLGNVDAGPMAHGSATANAQHTHPAGNGAPRNVARYRIVCPQFNAALRYSEGYVKCESCGFSEC